MKGLLPDIVDTGADRNPESEVFRFAGDGLTYAELARRSNSLSHVLTKAGVRRGDLVGIYSPKGLHIPVALNGIMKSGAAYVPLDPKTPSDRLATILADSGIRQVVTTDNLVANIGSAMGHGAQVDLLIGPENHALPECESITWHDVDSENGACWSCESGTASDMAYLMFTSGSTGIPKGIVHTHSSGMSYAATSSALYGLCSSDRLSGFPPLHFDQSTFDYFSGPLAGATTVIIPEMYMMIPASLSKMMELERLTVWYSVPYALIQLLQRGGLASRDLSSLRWVLFGGEVFPPKHLQALMRAWPQARFSNVYGPAELNQCTYAHVPSPDAGAWDEDTPVPLGSMWPDALGVVLDEMGNPVRPGEAGELIVSTPTMMQGYFRREDLNQKAFVYRKDESGESRRYYRTGDLVRVDENGIYHFIGRKDRQVKIRGYRIELDEVEERLASHPSVLKAAAFPVENQRGDRTLQAVVQLDDMKVISGDFDLDTARIFLAQKLPPYAIPDMISVVDNMPMTATGKLDYHGLQQRVCATAKYGSEKI